MSEGASRPLQRLLTQLALDQMDRDLFLGDPGKGAGRLFGGLVAAQSVVAAYRTVESGFLHSLHAYFLRPGSHAVPIRYVVYRIRDGRTFTTRDVVAYQSGEAIFNLSCSFTRPEEGVSRQEPMPEAPDPEGLPEWEIVRPDAHEDAERVRRWIRESPVEARSGDAEDGRPSTAAYQRRVWMRVKGILPEDPALHAALMAYASDRGLISTARLAHGASRSGFAASLDHTIWFHRPPRFDDWLLFTSRSPIAHGARALILGGVYRRDGTHVATIAQEGLIRSGRAAGESDS
ncbi:MAG: acyl-CoA thioesterase II [Dehalococcoidia bacterium]|nr:acyl-CoA thioesterase II [Dehalococcoidia bacterium]